MEDSKAYHPISFRSLLPVVAVALLGYGLAWFWSQGDQLLPILSRLWPTILLGLMLVLLGYTIRYGRWRLLLHALGEHPPIRTDARIWLGSYAFTATPAKAGEAVRSLLLKQECGIPAPSTLMALVVERITDGTAVLLLISLNIPLLLSWQLPVGALLVIGTVGVIGVWLLWQSRWLKILLSSILHRWLPRKMAGASRDGLITLTKLLQPSLMLQATAIGAVAWSLEGLSFWLLLRAIGASSLTWGGATVVHTAAGLLGAISLMPGGLGSTEASTVGLLVLQGVTLAAATPAALLIRLMTLWFATLLGVICLIWSSKRS